MATSYKGNTAVREAWESGSKTNADLDTIQQIKKGKYADLLAIQPAKGVELITGYVVSSSTLVSKRGLMGELTINLTEKIETVGTVPTGALRSTIETDMAQLEKPILAMSDYSGYAPEIALWKDAPADLRSQYKYTDADGDPQTLTGEGLKVAQLMLKGVETVLMFNPVISRTSIYKSRKDPENCGKIDTPPVTVPGTWVYLKTADRCIQQGDKSYQRTEQWTGAEEWSTDLYKAAT